MKLKLNNEGMKSIFIYLKFIVGYLLSEKSKMQKASIRIAEINAELVSLTEINRKIVLKQYVRNPQNKARTITLKTHEAFTLVKYQRVYESNPHCNKYIEYILNSNCIELWKELMR